MNRKPTYREFTSFLYLKNFRWHRSGTLLQGVEKFGEYLQGDCLTGLTRQAVTEKFGSWVKIFWSGSEYAPERSRQPMIVLLSTKAHKKEGRKL
jgi:hypothetical protein